jgi:hypothetical protein
MANENPCKTCDYFDPVIRARKETSWGWCAKKSVYPHKEGPGQVFPAGVKRVDNPQDLAKPKIVQRTQVVKECTFHKPRKNKPNKADLLKAMENK